MSSVKFEQRKNTLGYFLSRDGVAIFRINKKTSVKFKRKKIIFAICPSSSFLPHDTDL